MSDVHLRVGERYNFASLAGQPVVLDATDEHNRDEKFIRANTEITGTLKISSTFDVISTARFYGNLDGDGASDVLDMDVIEGVTFRGANDTNTYMSFPGSNANYIDWYTGGGHEMRLDSGGNLHVDADIVAYSSTVSDVRLKTNIQPLAGSLDIIMQLEGIKYDWKYRDEKGQIGMIAQEVEKVLPEAIHEGPKPFYASSSYKDVKDKHGKLSRKPVYDESNYKDVNYDMIVPHLIESIKTLKLEIDDLKLKLGDR